ncbi:MAG TPA: response regulator transcription factor [Anaerolineales bacterium]
MNQPGIQISAVLEEVSQIDPTLTSGPATILVDQLSDTEVIFALRAKAPQAGLLILVPSYDIAEVITFLQAGAIGLISLQATTGDLARAIIAVGRGEIVLPSDIAVQTLLALAQGQMASHGSSGTTSIGSIPGRESEQEAVFAEPLTGREVEVLNLLAQGLTNKDIAQSMVLSVRTVEAHLRSIFGKLDVRSRTEAVLWAVRNGYGVQGKQYEFP